MTHEGSNRDAGTAGAAARRPGGRSRGGARYHSPLREERAAQTRRRIADSARELFVAHGFSGTTISAIATRAGVAPQTVYATFGSKAAVMESLLTGLEDAADATGWRETLAQQSDPERLLEAFARWTTQMLGTSKDLIAAARDAVGDPSLTELAERGDEHRRQALESLVARISETGALRRDLSPARATDRAWMVSGVDLFLSATGRCGWSEDQYAEWLAELLCQQVLEPTR